METRHAANESSIGADVRRTASLPDRMNPSLNHCEAIVLQQIMHEIVNMGRRRKRVLFERKGFMTIIVRLDVGEYAKDRQNAHS